MTSKDAKHKKENIHENMTKVWYVCYAYAE